ncbi:LacI family DNA-binding transcriptional regulator [Pseudooctadecabacter jejudonensis]|uniref:HTH-type transcriptional regulator GalS n=1 Tax=Pseudooctadecabacter jejudonensis TaxID=1391910 RepID=A0A1Y5TM02_9RHOB|nr:LacI family DNA-binding transcriptional regulator [Pseudooctadecabacter jejudonensis]SLN63468.1 HTH-type transcriptional regulator GalS [Pseudooctadecabacter jejudonensis]
MVTMADVARRAGVSKATVSRAFSQPDVVDKSTRALVQAAVAELGYRPNEMARGLASRSSKTVGVVINRFDSLYYGALLDGAEKAIAAEGFKMLAESTRERAEGEREAWSSLLERQCEAVVVHSDSLNDDELTIWMQERPTSVLMNRFLHDVEDRCIHLDNRRGGAMAASYLYDKGHRTIAMVTGPRKFYEVRDRSAGFMETLRGLGVTPHVIESDFRVEGGYTAVLALLDRDPAITGIFFQNDEMAAGAYEACRERGVRVPDDLSMIGFDDIPVARHLMPKLTTIRQPLRDIGGAAGQLAHALATGQSDTSHIPRVFEAEVVERASVVEVKQMSHNIGAKALKQEENQ